MAKKSGLRRQPEAGPAPDAGSGVQGNLGAPRTSQPMPGHKMFSNLLSDTEITRLDEVWAADIIHVPMARASST